MSTRVPASDPLASRPTGTTPATVYTFVTAGPAAVGCAGHACRWRYVRHSSGSEVAAGCRRGQLHEPIRRKEHDAAPVVGAGSDGNSCGARRVRDVRRLERPVERVHRLLDDVAPAGGGVRGVPREQQAQLRIGAQVPDRRGRQLAGSRDRPLLAGGLALGVHGDRERGRHQGGDRQHRHKGSQAGRRPPFQRALAAGAGRCRLV